MAGYGYATPRYGSKITPTMQPFAPSRSLAQAAAGTPSVGDPFGLLSKRQSSPGSNLLDGGIVAPKSQPVQAPQGPVSAPPPAAQQPQPNQNTQQTPQTPAAPAYDLNTDPALQAVNAYSGLSDQQAQAAFEKQRRDALLQYGSEALVKQLTGDNTLAQAAAKNPTSTLAGLAHQRELTLRDLLNNLTTGGHNLGYSGYRVQQEGELGRQYQDALAQAAANEQGYLDTLSGNLNAAKQTNAQSRASALGDAYNREQQFLLQNPPTGDQSGTVPPGPQGLDNLAGTGGILQAIMPGGFMTRTRRFGA